MAEIAKSGTPSLSSPLPPSNEQTTGLTAGEALAAFDAVYIDNTGKVRKGNGAAATAPARVRGWVPAAHAINDRNVTVYHGNINVNYGAGLTPGADYFLSGTVAGGLADVATTGGTFAIAYAIDATRVRLLSSR